MSRRFPSHTPTYRRDRGVRGDHSLHITDQWGNPAELYLDQLSLNPRAASVFQRNPVGGLGNFDHRSLSRRHIHANYDSYSYPLGYSQGVIEEHQTPRWGGRMARKDGPPFGKAMSKLFRQLGKAEDFYSSFQQNYDSDVQSLQNYATLDALNELWKMRVAGKKDKRLASDDDDQGEPEDERAREKFEENKKNVQHALEDALNSTVTVTDVQHSRKAKIRLESSKRLREKVLTARDQIYDLLDSAVRGREECDALLNEIRMLKTLVDPENDLNRELYKSAGSEGDFSDNEDEEDGP